MTVQQLYELSLPELQVMFDALNAEMISPDWSDTAIVNGMLAIDWAEFVCSAYDLKRSFK